MKLQTLPGVFHPRSDSWSLADAIGVESLGGGSRSLDLCTGSGIAAIAAAQGGAQATAVDVSRRALASTWFNARRNGARVRVRHGHLFEPVRGQRFDLISANPPYVPSGDDLPQSGASRAWEAGADGRAILDQICDQVADHLRPHGRVLLVHSALIGEDQTLDRLAAAGLDPATIDRTRGPLGPLMREQQRAGRIPPDVDEEDVVIIRGVLRP